MPSSPTPTQAEASRRNGALSHGPTTPEGRATSARNGSRHGLRADAPFRLLPGEDEAAFVALRDALGARHTPADTAERHWVEEMAFALWRQRRLRALEIAALDAAGDTIEPDEGAPRLPSLATLARYRARIERDHRLALAELGRLQQLRPRLPRELAEAGADQLRYLADRMDEQAASGALDGDTDEPEEPSPAAVTSLDARANPTTPLNRRERRRLAALERRAAA